MELVLVGNSEQVAHTWRTSTQRLWRYHGCNNVHTLVIYKLLGLLIVLILYCYWYSLSNLSVPDKLSKYSKHVYLIFDVNYSTIWIYVWTFSMCTFRTATFDQLCLDAGSSWKYDFPLYQFHKYICHRKKTNINEFSLYVNHMPLRILNVEIKCTIL